MYVLIGPVSLLSLPFRPRDFIFLPLLVLLVMALANKDTTRILQSHKSQSSALLGLTKVDLNEIGPWVTVQSSQPEQPFPELRDQLSHIARQRLTEAGIETTSTNEAGSTVSSPRLKLAIGYAEGRPLRGPGRLQYIRLYLEDQVQLQRNPPTTMQIVSWSAERLPGSLTKEQIKDDFSLLLDEFTTDSKPASNHH